MAGHCNGVGAGCLFWLADLLLPGDSWQDRPAELVGVLHGLGEEEEKEQQRPGFRLPSGWCQSGAGRCSS